MGVLNRGTGLLDRVEGSGIISGGSSGGGKVATLFDGSTDAIRRTTEFTGAVDSKLVTFSIWFACNAGDSTTRRLFEFQFRQRAQVSNINNLQIDLADSVGGQNARIIFGMGDITDSAWHHWLVSIDLNGATSTTVQSYVDGVENGVISLLVDSEIEFTRPAFNLGSSATPDGFWPGCLSEVYINPGVRVDLDDPNIRLKWRTAAGKPANLGPDGSKPTGAAPLIYMPNGGIDGVNLGTGGNLDSIIGTPVVCGDPPA